MLKDLPELVLNLVCGHLSYEDMLALRSTCRGLRQFVDEIQQFTKLNLFVQKFSCYHRLFYTREMVGHQHSFHSDSLTILTASRFREQFANVQRMVICNKKIRNDFDGRICSEFDLSCLNFFISLSHLELSEFPYFKGKLDLPELQVAGFQLTLESGRFEAKFELACPKLRALKIERCNPVLTSDPNLLEYLHLDFFHYKLDLKTISRNLPKLSTICLEYFDSLMELFSDLETKRLSLPSLNQIRLESACYKCSLFQEELIQLADGLENLRRYPHTEHIQFILFGRPILSPSELRQIIDQIAATLCEGFVLPFKHDPCLLFLKGIPELSFLLSALWDVVYEEFELSEELIKDLKGVEVLEFRYRCKKRFRTLKRFARTCQTLYSLTLHNQNLTEKLLKMLSNHLVNLEKIRITECRYKTLKPLAEFRNLEFVYLDFDPPKDQLIFIFENSQTLETVHILCKPSIELLRTRVLPRLNLITISKKFFKFDTLEAMINYYYEKNLFEKRTLDDEFVL